MCGTWRTSSATTSRTRTRAATCCSATSPSASPPGRTVGVVGANGVGKSTLFGVLAGDAAGRRGRRLDRRAASRYMRPGRRRRRRRAHRARAAAVDGADGAARRPASGCRAPSAALAAGDDDGRRWTLGTAIGDWSELGGYELEGQWDARLPAHRAQRLRRAGRPARGDAVGRRAQAARARRSCFASDADVLLLDEPDNFLDVPAKRALEQQIARVAEDGPRHLPRPRAAQRRRRLRSSRWRATARGCTTAPTPPTREAREERQRRLGDAVKRWKDEEQRLRELVRTFKERARYSPVWAKKADADRDALEALRRRRARRPRPSPTSRSRSACAARDSARTRARPATTSAIDGLVEPFSDEVHFGERVGLIGPNGGGKTHLMRALAGEPDVHERRGPDRQPRLDRHLHPAQPRDDFAGRGVLDVVMERTGALRAGDGRARALRPRGGGAARATTRSAAARRRAWRSSASSSRATTSCCSTSRPTTSTSTPARRSSRALDGFEGTVVAVSHDRAFLRRMDRCRQRGGKPFATQGFPPRSCGRASANAHTTGGAQTTFPKRCVLGRRQARQRGASAHPSRAS